LSPGLNITKFRRSRCFVAGRYYQIRIIYILAEEVTRSDSFEVSCIDNISNGNNNIAEPCNIMLAFILGNSEI